MSVSIKNIAHEIGVSNAAVSMALRNDPRISAARRKQIQRVAKEMGYAPNRLAQGLRGQLTRSVGILWSLAGPHASEGLVRQITRFVQQRGYVPYIVDSLSDMAVVSKALAELAARGVDGVVIQLGTRKLVDAVPALLHKYAFRAAVMVPDHKVDASLSQVIRSWETAIADAGEHLARSGRRRPVYLMSQGCEDERNRKISAFCRGFARGGGNPGVVAALRIAESDPLQVAAALDGDWPEDGFDALMCTNDEFALAAIDWLSTRGRRVPEDTAVVGFNNSIAGQLTRPRLASADRREREVAEAIDTLLFQFLENCDDSHGDQMRGPRCIDLPMQFIWRESAGGDAQADAQKKES